MPHIKPFPVIFASELGVPPERSPVEVERDDLTGEIAEHRAFEQILQYLQHAKDLGLDASDPDVIRHAIKAGSAAYNAGLRGRGETPTYAIFSQVGGDDRHPPIVYYMRLDKLIKIGTTTRLGCRVSAIMPHGVAAVEPGGEVRERGRHKQFAAKRASGEWFRLDHELANHIADLRDLFERETGESTDDWLRRHTPTPGRVRHGASTQMEPRNMFLPVALPGTTLPADAAELVPGCIAVKAAGVSRTTLSGWRRKGWLLPAAQTRNGRMLYRISEVQALSPWLRRKN